MLLSLEAAILSPLLPSLPCLLSNVWLLSHYLYSLFIDSDAAVPALATTEW